MLKVQKTAAIMLPIIAVVMTVYHLLYTQILLQDPVAHNVTHLGLALTVVSLSLLVKDTKQWPVKITTLLLSAGVTAYLLIYLDEILRFRSAIPAPSDLVIGVCAIIVLFMANWFVFGKTFPIIAGVSTLYLIFGRFLPQPFTVPAVKYGRLIMWLSIEFGSGEGVFGSILGISAIYLFLFIIFGSFLDGFGGTRFIIGLGRWVGSKFKGGAALTALLGSALVGTVTGSTVANVTITGSFTIPMMQRTGYTPEQAGAIEAAASNGGQIMPPVMGATAFVLAGFARIPYIQVAVAAIIPALIYFFCVFWYIFLSSRKMDIQPLAEKTDPKQLFLDAPLFFLPLAVLVFLLMKGFTLPFVGFWSIVTLVVIGSINALLRKDIHLSFKEVIAKITRGVSTASEIAIICALIGLVATSLKVSGLGIKLPLVIGELSGGILFVTLLIAMCISLFLGMGVPTTAAYLLVAIGAVPVLMRLGVSTIQGHLFCFVFAAFSHLTPPVALGALVASKIAGGHYWKTSWEAVKAGFTAFLIPYFIIYTPVIILCPDGPLYLGILELVGIALSILILGAAFSNYLLARLQAGERICYFLVGIGSLVFVFTSKPLLLAIIIFLTALITAKHCRRSGKKAN